MREKMNPGNKKLPNRFYCGAIRSSGFLEWFFQFALHRIITISIQGEPLLTTPGTYTKRNVCALSFFPLLQVHKKVFMVSWCVHNCAVVFSIIFCQSAASRSWSVRGRCMQQVTLVFSSVDGSKAVWACIKTVLNAQEVVR